MVTPLVLGQVTAPRNQPQIKIWSGLRYPRVAMAEGFDADQHPDVVSGLQLTLAPLHLIVICR